MLTRRFSCLQEGSQADRIASPGIRSHEVFYSFLSYRHPMILVVPKAIEGSLSVKATSP